MSVSFRETKDSRAFDLNAKDGSATWKFLAQATGESNPENAVYAAILADTTNVPYVWNGLDRGKPSATPLGNGWYDVSLPYRKPEGPGGTDPTATTPSGGQPPNPPPPPPRPEDLLQEDVSLRIGGKPPRIYRSWNTVASYALPGKQAPNFKRSVNVSKDGKVEGVELPEPATVLTINRTFPYVTWRYLMRVAECCWHNNEQAWGPFPAGMALLMSANLKMQKDGRFGVAFDIGLDFGEKNIDIRGDGQLVVLDRPSWCYVWAAYNDEKDDNAGRLAQRAFAAYVEELVDGKDFSTLAIF